MDGIVLLDLLKVFVQLFVEMDSELETSYVTMDLMILMDAILNVMINLKGLSVLILLVYLLNVGLFVETAFEFFQKHVTMETRMMTKVVLLIVFQNFQVGIVQEEQKLLMTLAILSVEII